VFIGPNGSFKAMSDTMVACADNKVPEKAFHLLHMKLSGVDLMATCDINGEGDIRYGAPT
jgi:hypothetical protein